MKRKGDLMGYSIIFQTKIVKLSDGRFLHLDLSGCNNDDCGRDPDDWRGKIYTEDEFVKYAEGFMRGGKPTEDCFDLKIGSRYCSMYDYGEHLLRMKKRAITLEELRHSGKYVSFNRVDGADVYDDDGNITTMSLKEFDDYCYEKLYNGGIRYRMNYTLLESEKDITNAFDNGDAVRIYISK
jgi:hypothetical protein